MGRRLQAPEAIEQCPRAVWPLVVLHLSREGAGEREPRDVLSLLMAYLVVPLNSHLKP